MAEYDLTTKIGVYLDRHLVLPLLEFLSANGIYDEKELLQGKLDILSNTKMVDFAADTYMKLGLNSSEEMPPEYVQKRNDVLSELRDLQGEADGVFKIFLDPEVSKFISKQPGPKQLTEFITKNNDFKPEMLDTLYNAAKLQYECGHYSYASEYLYFHRQLVPMIDKNFLSGLWGKLASEILMQRWDAALEDLNRLKDYIENGSVGTTLDSLQQRTWLIHWSLFVFFNHIKGRDHIIDMFLNQPRYLNTIQTTCPHILRYLATAVITNKHRRSALKDLVKVIQQESYNYKDPVTEFIECLFVNFDFDGAQQKLRDCQTVLMNDFFLIACLDDFIENARLLIFETFCRIHQCISIDMLSQKLNMTPEDAERWIVELIRDAHMDAKIDSRLGHVVMGTKAVSPYQQVMEKTKNLTLRSHALAIQVSKKLSRNDGENTWHQDM